MQPGIARFLMQSVRRSFAYGNAKIENDQVTWEMVVEADEAIKAELAAK